MLNIVRGEDGGSPLFQMIIMEGASLMDGWTLTGLEKPIRNGELGNGK